MPGNSSNRKPESASFRVRARRSFRFPFDSLDASAETCHVVMALAQNGSRRSRDGFSLLELLVVVAVIAAFLTVAVPLVSDVGEAARESAILRQEQTVNGAYRALKSVRSPMPTNRDDILQLLASDPNVRLQPPLTMSGPEGLRTLQYLAATDEFAYIGAGGVRSRPGGAAPTPTP